MKPKRLFEALTSSRRSVRLRALEALTLARAGDVVGGDYVLGAAERILAFYHIRDLPERREIARFFETWFLWERSHALSRRLAVTRMEEVDEGIRESLLSAVYSVMPNGPLIEHLVRPGEEHLGQGLGLLMILEALAYRIRARHFVPSELPPLLEALCAARGMRGSHIARPFLWRLEDVIAKVREVASRYRV
jgi:hypothetical protein